MRHKSRYELDGVVDCDSEALLRLRSISESSSVSADRLEPPSPAVKTPVSRKS